MKLSKLISVVCAALIALTTIIYTALPAFASTDEEIVPSSAEEIAELLYDSIYSGSDYLGVKPTFTAFFEELIEAGWYYSEDVLALIDPTSDYQYSRGGSGGLIRSGRSGGGGRLRVDSADDVVVGTETFVEIVDRLNQQYSPKNAKSLISWRNDIRWSEATGSNSNTYGCKLTFFQDGSFCGNSDWHDVYLMPFYFDGTNQYYGAYQFHFWQELSQDSSGNNVLYLYCDVIDNIDNKDNITLLMSKNLTTLRYIDICLMSSGYYIYYNTYASYSDFINRSGSLQNVNVSIPSGYSLADYLSLDLSSSIYMTNAESHFKKTVSSHDSSCSKGCDVGYLCSNELIDLAFDFDLTKFNSNDTVAFTGDTIYDYTITNNEGDSTTINEYVTNNYTYITNNNGDEGDGDSSDSGSGTTSGNVIVGGNVSVDGAIDVGGQVDVNINVTQNDTSSGSSSDFLVPVDDYAQYLPEVAPEVTDYLETTYSFLPPEIVALIIGGIGAAVICRILGR